MSFCPNFVTDKPNLILITAHWSKGPSHCPLVEQPVIFFCLFSGGGRAYDREPRVRAVAPWEGHQRDHLRRDDLCRVLSRRQGLLPGRLGRPAHDRDRGQVRQTDSCCTHVTKKQWVGWVNSHPLCLWSEACFAFLLT